MEEIIEIRKKLNSCLAQLQNKTINLEDFLNYLRKDFPFDVKNLRLNAWTIVQAIMVFYGIDFLKLQLVSDVLALHDIAKMIDVERIGVILINHSGEEICPRADTVSVNLFVPFLESKGVIIPNHLAFSGEDTVRGNSVNDRKPRASESRKHIMRYAAELYWSKEKKEREASGKDTAKLTGPTALAKKKEIKELVNLINHIGGLSPHAKEVDIEWFADLYPGKNKPGPKRKS